MEADIPTASKDDAAGIEHGCCLFYIRDITTEYLVDTGAQTSVIPLDLKQKTHGVHIHISGCKWI